MVDGVFGHLPGPVLLARPSGQSTTFSERDLRVEVEEEWLRSELGYQPGDGLGHRLVREWITVASTSAKASVHFAGAHHLGRLGS